jgi:hypothetical protein
MTLIQGATKFTDMFALLKQANGEWKIGDALPAGVTRAEYLRRVLAEQRGPAVTREHLDRFAERTAD